MTKKDKDFTINRASYARHMKLLSFLEQRLGLNIKVHTDPAHFEHGQIFLFNHFARFETVIPPYLIHKYTGKHCRAIAHHTLFKAHPALDKFLREHGAVPNRMSGLLPFLAAEILRGQKVLIFPEGGMVKDRRVLDDKGRYRIFSPEREQLKEVHRGAAALAFTLDLLKHRIRHVFANNERDRIDHWCRALEMTEDKLHAAAQQPTLIVPGSITFYPLRTNDNAISNIVDKLAGGLPAGALEELIVEGNILLKDTDMDIRTTEPQDVSHHLSNTQEFLLHKFFEQVRSLDDLFALRDNATGTVEKMLARFMRNASGKIRNAYADAIYKLTTVHLDHLASTVLTELAKKNTKLIDKKQFCTILNIIIQELNKNCTIHLHRDLQHPRTWYGLEQYDSPKLDAFLRRCEENNLVETSASSIILNRKALCNQHSFHNIRVENPVAVYANEVAPIEAIGQAVKQAIKLAPKVSPHEAAKLTFEAEEAAYQFYRKEFDKPQYDDINKKQTTSIGGEPRWHHNRKAKVGVLLVHGFMARPAQMDDLATFLHHQGYSTLSMRLPGHGTSPWDLHGRNWQQWLDAVKRNYSILTNCCEKVVMVGFSTGGALALLHAESKPPKLAGVAGAGIPLVIQGRGISLVPWMNRLNKLSARLPGKGRQRGGVYPFYATISKHPELEYQHIPMPALHEVLKITRQLKKHASSVAAPTLLLQATKDPVVLPRSAEKLQDMMPNAQVKWIESDQHALIYKNIGSTWRDIAEFIKQQTTDTEESSS